MRKRYLLALGIAALLIAALSLLGVVSAAGGGGDAAKQTFLQQQAAKATADAKGPHAPKNPGNAPAQPQPCPQHFQPGVYTFHGAPGYVMHAYDIVNAATAIASSGEAYTILAGSAIGDPSQGVVLVERLVLDPCSTSTRYPTVPYPMPSKQGAITLTGVDGSAVSFVTATGASGRFAYATGQFLT